MATLARGYTFGTTETVTAAKLHSLVDSATISNIVAADLAAGAVSGAKILMGSDTRGDLLYFNGTAYARLPAGTSGQFLKSGGTGADPSWDTPSGLATFTTPSVLLSDTAAEGNAGTTLRSNCTIAAFDATLPTSLAIGDSAAVGDAAFAARRNHKHGAPAFATPALTFSTSNSAGVATTLLRSDAQIALFDATLPAEIEYGGAGSAGSAAVAARRDHVHPIDEASGGNDVTFYAGTTSVSVTVATDESVVLYGSVAGKKGTGAGSTTVTLTLKRDSTSLGTAQFAITDTASNAAFMIPIAKVDSPSAGTYSYNLSITVSDTPPGATADVYALMAIKKSA